MVRPQGGRAYDRKFHASAECWAVFEDVLAREFQFPALFANLHQLTVDAYAVQHAGGRHPDKSVAIHLAGLYLALEEGLPSADIAPRLQRLAGRADWPRLEAPRVSGSRTILDVASASEPEAHTLCVKEWAMEVWNAWAPCHATARELVRSGSPPGRAAGRGSEAILKSVRAKKRL